MLVFTVRRLLALPLVVVAVSVLIVALMQALPPEQRASAYARNPNQLRDIPAIIREYRLDRPFVEQYFAWASAVLTGNLGYSRASGQAVLETIRQRFPATLELALYAALPITVIGVWLGTRAALRRDSVLDHATRALAVAGYSLPTFVLGVWLLALFYGGFGVLPGFGNLSNDFSLVFVTGEVRRITGLVTLDALLAGRVDVALDALRHLVLPVTTLVVVSSAPLIKAMRSSLLETLSADYVRTARAKGLSERAVNLKHARGNALLPITTVTGATLTGLLSGSVLTEAIFAYPGIGGWGAKAAQQLDFAGVLGFALFVAVIVVVCNLIVDLLYAIVDPRVRFD